jgi:WD40 repeat protein
MGGVVNIEFGATQDEIIAFHGFSTKLTIFSLKNSRSQVIKFPKFSHCNGYGYRPVTRHFAVLLKLEGMDTLTLHERGTYAVVTTIALPTVDAQGLRWSPDGSWLAVWDTASAGTKVVIYTANGQHYRTYTVPEHSFDLGVGSLEWSPDSSFLAVGKHDGTLDLLRSTTVGW